MANVYSIKGAGKDGITYTVDIDDTGVHLRDSIGNSWYINTASTIDSPTGGATVDAEARIAIDDIIFALQDAGIVAP
jgi:hypothetical protein